MSARNLQRSIPRLLISTLVVVVAVFAAGELVLRSQLDSLSDNARRVASGPVLAEQIDEASARDSHTVLILGNSVSLDSIDPEIVQEYLPDTFVAHQALDSSVMRDWYYLLSNFYVDAGVSPDTVVLPLGFENPLLRTNARTEDLLFSVLGWDDLSGLAERSDISDLDELISLYTNKASATVAFRGRLQQRILTETVPGFPDLRRTIRDRNIELRATEANGEESETTGEPIWLDEFGSLTAELGIDVVVVAVPTEDLERGLGEEDLQRISDLGWSYIAPPAGETWSDEEIPDGHHMSRSGEVRYSNLLGPLLDEVLARR